MTYARKTKCTVARCPWCSWSKLIFGSDIRELRLKATLETLSHLLTFRIADRKGGVR